MISFVSTVVVGDGDELILHRPSYAGARAVVAVTLNWYSE